MPSQAMQDSIDALRDRRKAGAGQAPATLAERRAAFVPGDRLHPVPDDVQVMEVTAGGVKAARRSSSGGGAWLALAFCRSPRASIESCMAWLGMSASPLAWAARQRA